MLLCPAIVAAFQRPPIHARSNSFAELHYAQTLSYSFTCPSAFDFRFIFCLKSEMRKKSFLMVTTIMYNFITITKIKIEFFLFHYVLLHVSRHPCLCYPWHKIYFVFVFVFICICVYLYKVLKRACAATLDSNFVLLMVRQWFSYTFNLPYIECLYCLIVSYLV